MPTGGRGTSGCARRWERLGRRRRQLGSSSSSSSRAEPLRCPSQIIALALPTSTCPVQQLPLPACFKTFHHSVCVTSLGHSRLAGAASPPRCVSRMWEVGQVGGMGSKSGTGYTGRRDWLEERERERGQRGRAGECQYRPARSYRGSETCRWRREEGGGSAGPPGIRSQGQCHLQHQFAWHGGGGSREHISGASEHRWNVMEQRRGQEGQNGEAKEGGAATSSTCAVRSRTAARH